MIHTLKNLMNEVDICKAWLLVLGVWTIILTVFVGFLVCDEFKKIMNDDVQIVDIREIQLEMLDVKVEPIKPVATSKTLEPIE